MLFFRTQSLFAGANLQLRQWKRETPGKPGPASLRQVLYSTV